MFRKAFCNAIRSAAETRRTVCTRIAMRGLGNKDSIFEKKKGRTPYKIQRYKCLLLKPMSLQQQEQRNENGKRLVLEEPTAYFLGKKSKLCQPATHNFSSDARKISEHKKMRDEKSPLRSVLVALDCEMVACKGNPNSLARCSIVDYDSAVILDLYVSQTLPVLNYRTQWSGISKEVLEQKSCVSFETARNLAKIMLQGKLLVGHTVDCDLFALGLTHPQHQTIDIGKKHIQAMLSSIQRRSGLKFLAKNHLNRTIQNGPHCSVEDAQATMDIFKLIEIQWLAKNKDFLTNFIGKEEGSFLEDKYWPPNIQNE